jgi:hypothetical protein
MQQHVYLMHTIVSGRLLVINDLFVVDCLKKPIEMVILSETIKYVNS